MSKTKPVGKTMGFCFKEKKLRLFRLYVPKQNAVFI